MEREGQGLATPGPPRGARLRLLLRALAFGVLVVVVWLGAYRPSLEKRTFVEAKVEQALDAAAEGHLFHLERGEHLIRFDRLPYGDMGLPVLVSAAVGVARAVLGEEWRPGPALVYRILLAVFCLTCLVFLTDGIPLTVALAGSAAFVIGVLDGALGFVNPQRWGGAYCGLVTAVFAVTLLAPTLRPARRWLSLAMLAALASLGVMLRQEGSLSVHAGSAAIVGSTVFLLLGARALQLAAPWRAAAGRLAASAVLGVGLLQAAVAAGPLGQRLAYAWAWGVPFGETRAVVHGAGHNPYIGLGYVSNPYNIAWMDHVGMVHAELMKPEASFGSETYQATLFEAWARLAVEAPWLHLNNVLAKLRDLDRWLGNPRRTRGHVMRALYLAAPWLAGASLLLALFRLSPVALVATTSLLVVAAAAFSPGFLVHPMYTGGAQGGVLVATLLMPAAVAAFWQDGRFLTAMPRRRRAHALARLAAAPLGACALGLLLLVQGYSTRRSEHQDGARRFLAADPSERLARDEYAFAHIFNDLAGPEQEAILRELLARWPARRPSWASGPLEQASGAEPPAPAEVGSGFFRPLLAAETGDQLHVFVWMGSDHPGPRTPGVVDELVTVCAACEALPGVFEHDPRRVVATGVNSQDWTDTYRMYSFRVRPSMLGAESLLVGLQRIVGPGPDGHYGYSLDTRAQGRLSRE